MEIIYEEGNDIHNVYIAKLNSKERICFQEQLNKLQFAHLFRCRPQTVVKAVQKCKIHIDFESNIITHRFGMCSNLQAQLGPGQGSTFAHVLVAKSCDNACEQDGELIKKLVQKVREAFENSADSKKTYIVYGI